MSAGGYQPDMSEPTRTDAGDEAALEQIGWSPRWAALFASAADDRHVPARVIRADRGSVLVTTGGDTLRRIVQEVSAARDLNHALETIVRRVKGSIRADVCSVYLTDFDVVDVDLTED